MKIHSGHIEVAVAELLNPRVYVIVPNVHWGLGIHECDMLALDTSNRFTEIEIKISASDLKADFKKQHGHKSKIISRLIYAMPSDLCDSHGHLIPDGCGVIKVKWIDGLSKFKAEWVYSCRHDKNKDKPSADQIINFMRLGCMRIWSLKAKNNR